jgi:MurNAc alpha-1-phosphate uridylyltransferase
MKALILAAGRGERMRPLTDRTPKPLLQVRGKRLVEWHLEALARAGVREVVVNTAWLEEQFPAALGDGARYGVKITYSFEGRDHGGALETAGGIAKALPLLADSPGSAFWVVSGDVFVPDFTFPADAARAFAESDALGQLWLVDNAPHHPAGDFGITADGLASRDAAPRLTWASVGLFRAALFADIAVGTKLALRPKLELAIDQRRLRAARYDGRWTDVGTLERLAQLQSPQT